MPEEYDLAEYRCAGCGEYFTEFEIMEKARKDETCKNCGGTTFKKKASDINGAEVKVIKHTANWNDILNMD